MQIGAMNHPAHDVVDSIARIADMGFDFIDLSLEPPMAASWRIDVAAVAAALAHYNLNVVGHTAYFLPLASPIDELRTAAVTELKRCLRVFADLGAHWMNIHPGRDIPFHDRAFVIQRNLETIQDLSAGAKHLGIGIMIENMPTEHNTVSQLAELLDPVPDLGLHLDIGHANLLAAPGNAVALIQSHGSRIRHVHLHDNLGNEDLHWRLGTGNVDVQSALAALYRAGYKDTITLEVFTPDPQDLIDSRHKVREIWDALTSSDC